MIKFFINIKDSWNSLSIVKKMIISSLIIFILISIFGTLLILYDSMGGFDTYAIIHYRLPRIPLLIIMGVGTPLSALLIQKITKNKLADTGLIGVADSGVLALSILSIFFPRLINPINDRTTLTVITPLVIGAAALITLLLLYVLSIKRGVSPRRVIMMGIGLHILFSGAATLVVYFNNGYEMTFFNRYLVGFIERKIKILWITSIVVIAVCFIIAWCLGKKLDIIESDEVTAKSVGIRIELLKIITFIIISVIIGFTVASVGSVALLGLLLPNLARSIVGNKTRSLILTTALLGILLMFVAQFININMLHIAAPIGILLQIIIAPYFIFKIFRGNK